jgi:chromosomal replication initiation ATPase DnaA
MEPRISGADIVTSTCAALGVNRSFVVGPMRSPELFQCRRVIALRLREWGLTLTEIGVELGGRHYTTVLSMLRGGKGKRERDQSTHGEACR